MGLVQTLQPHDFTLADLDAMPDDGRQYELVDGMLLVTPCLLKKHQDAVIELIYLLRSSCPKHLKVSAGPMEYRPSDKRSLQPDVFVADRADTDPKAYYLPLLLVVEVLSRSTKSQDLLLKRGVYEEAGVDAYWMFDPEEQVLTVLELEDGRYVERAVVKGEDVFEATRPFPVRVVPAELVD